LFKIFREYRGNAKAAKEVVKLAPGQEEELSQIENKMLKVGFEVVIRIVKSTGSDSF
jgi:hypothetical protein